MPTTGVFSLLAFGGAGVIADNDRVEQRKIIKYNQLFANCLILFFLPNGLIAPAWRGIKARLPFAGARRRAPA